jgi:hypothetical protein
MIRIDDITTIYLPVLLFLTIWIISNKTKKKILIQIAVLTVMILTVMIYGCLSIVSKYYSEITAIGNAVFLASPLILLGPTLILIEQKIDNKRRKCVIGSISTLVIPIIAVYICFFLLALTGQISGM